MDETCNRNYFFETQSQAKPGAAQESANRAIETPTQILESGMREATMIKLHLHVHLIGAPSKQAFVHRCNIPITAVLRSALAALCITGSLEAAAIPVTATLERTFAGGAAGDALGSSVALSGNLALVGAVGATPDGGEGGAAYLYDTDTGNLLHTFAGNDEFDFMGVSVAVSGGLALVGASGADTSNGLDSGAAYLYSTETGDLLQTFKGTGAADLMGWSVALDGNLALVGAKLADTTNGNNSGAAYLYDTDTGNLLHTFEGTQEGSEMGYSVALSGNRALVGAWEEDYNGPDSGAAYLYDTDTGNLLQTFYGPAPGDFLGASVALDGTRALLGAPFADINGGNSGIVALVDTDTGDVLQTFEGNAEGDQLGTSVALSGNFALLGEINADRNGQNSGAAYLYTTDGTLLQTFDGAAAGDTLGYSSALSGNLALIGARDADPNALENSGAAYLYRLTLPQQDVPAPGTFALAVLGLAATARRTLGRQTHRPV